MASQHPAPTQPTSTTPAPAAEPVDQTERFFKAIAKYDTAIPDEVVQHYLRRGGVGIIDDTARKIVAVAAQKMIVDTLSEARQKTSRTDGRFTMTAQALQRDYRLPKVARTKP